MPTPRIARRGSSGRQPTPYTRASASERGECLFYTNFAFLKRPFPQVKALASYEPGRSVRVHGKLESSQNRDLSEIPTMCSYKMNLLPPVMPKNVGASEARNAGLWQSFGGRLQQGAGSSPRKCS